MQEMERASKSKDADIRSHEGNVNQSCRKIPLHAHRKTASKCFQRCDWWECELLKSLWKGRAAAQKGATMNNPAIALL